MAQIYVLDTSVLIHDPHSIKNFDHHRVVIPLTVLSELDSLKAGNSQASYSAREAARVIDTVREAGHSLQEFSKIPGTEVEIRVESYNPGETYLPRELDISVKDNQIISTACKVSYLYKDADVVLVSKDAVMRLTAESIGLKAENYKKDKVSNSYIFKDTSVKVDLTAEEYAKLTESGEVPCAALATVKDHSLLSCDLHKSRASILVKTSVHFGEETTHFVRLITNKTLKPWDIRAKNTEQLYALYLLNEPSIKLVTMMGLAGSGKAQPLDEPIATPNGWKLMGDILVGDKVLSESGEPVTVSGVFPQGLKKVYRVTFSDGSETRCCGEHLWLTGSTIEKARNGYHWSKKTTLEIRDTLRYGKSQKINHEIPLTQPVQYSEKDLPLDPYLLGAILGDGSISQNAVYFTTADYPIVLRISRLLRKYGCRLTKASSKYSYRIVQVQRKIAGTIDYTYQYTMTSIDSGEKTIFNSFAEVSAAGFTRQVDKAIVRGIPHRGFLWEKTLIFTGSTNPIKRILVSLCLMGTNSYTKFIPKEYLYASVEQRIALLQGLMDTDGTIDRKKGSPSYSTSSPQLALDVRELVESLGGTGNTTVKLPTYIYKGERRKGKPNYRVWVSLPNEIMPVWLPRKKELWKKKTRYFPKRYIHDVIEIGDLPCQCIMVESSTNLYLTKHYIATHNTLMSLASGLAQTCDEGRYKKILILRPTVSAGEEIGFLPGSMEEKLAPWMKPVHDAVEFILKDKSSDEDTSKADYLFNSGVIEVDAISFIRGRSIDNAFIYIDECQNLTPTILKLLISRAGSKSKVIVAGDIDQIDAIYLDKYSTGLAVVAERFRDQHIAGHVILTKSERSKLAQLAAELL